MSDEINVVAALMIAVSSVFLIAFSVMWPLFIYEVMWSRHYNKKQKFIVILFMGPVGWVLTPICFLAQRGFKKVMYAMELLIKESR